MRCAASAVLSKAGGCSAPLPPEAEGCNSGLPGRRAWTQQRPAPPLLPSEFLRWSAWLGIACMQGRPVTAFGLYRRGALNKVNHLGELQTQ